MIETNIGIIILGVLILLLIIIAKVMGKGRPCNKCVWYSNGKCVLHEKYTNSDESCKDFEEPKLKE